MWQTIWIFFVFLTGDDTELRGNGGSETRDDMQYTWSTAELEPGVFRLHDQRPLAIRMLNQVFGIFAIFKMARWKGTMSMWHHVAGPTEDIFSFYLLQMWPQSRIAIYLYNKTSMNMTYHAPDKCLCCHRLCMQTYSGAAVMKKTEQKLHEVVQQSDFFSPIPILISKLRVSASTKYWVCNPFG